MSPTYLTKHARRLASFFVPKSGPIVVLIRHRIRKESQFRKPTTDFSLRPIVKFLTRYANQSGPPSPECVPRFNKRSVFRIGASPDLPATDGEVNKERTVPKDWTDLKAASQEEGPSVLVRSPVLRTGRWPVQ